jgi:cell division septum initiation protein DivIVA
MASAVRRSIQALSTIENLLTPLMELKKELGDVQSLDRVINERKLVRDAVLKEIDEGNKAVANAEVEASRAIAAANAAAKDIKADAAKERDLASDLRRQASEVLAEARIEAAQVIAYADKDGDAIKARAKDDAEVIAGQSSAAAIKLDEINAAIVKRQADLDAINNSIAALQKKFGG